MNDEKQEIFCGKCNSPIIVINQDVTQERSPCKNCGSKIRHFNISISVALRVSTRFKLHSKHGRIRTSRWKPAREIYSGDSLFNKTGKWSSIFRLIDRRNDWYEEKITDLESSKVLVDKAEPLSKHTGRGSAKQR